MAGRRRAGVGEESAVQGRENFGAYAARLKAEYQFLAAKFSLRPVPRGLWQMARLRPQGHPHLRMAALAALVARRDLFASVVEAADLDALLRVLAVRLDGHWQTHYSLVDDASASRRYGLGRSTLLSVAVNAVAPIIYAYGQWQGDESASERALALLQSIPAEENRYISWWHDAGVEARTAFDTQALLHLAREYCERRQCMRCRLGCWLVRHT